MLVSFSSGAWPRRRPRPPPTGARAAGRSSPIRRTALTLIALTLAPVLGVLGGPGSSVGGQIPNQVGVRLDVTFTGNFVQDALEGETASAGLKDFAETGATDLLVAEFAASSATASTYPGHGAGGTFPQTAWPRWLRRLPSPRACSPDPRDRERALSSRRAA